MGLQRLWRSRGLEFRAVGVGVLGQTQNDLIRLMGPFWVLQPTVVSGPDPSLVGF